VTVKPDVVMVFARNLKPGMRLHRIDHTGESGRVEAIKKIESNSEDRYDLQLSSWEGSYSVPGDRLFIAEVESF
jgi:hypothetical protein